MSGIKAKAFGILICSFVFCILSFTFPCYAEIKEPNAAGSFYPDDKKELARMVDGFLDSAVPVVRQERVFCLICPHAGYIYSGQTQGYGYKLLENKYYNTVIIIGPSHQYGFSGISVYPQGFFRTPLGDIEIDNDFVSKILDKEKGIYFDPLAFTKEHSVEVQLPFLQRVLPQVKIVPVIMGNCSFEACYRFSCLLKDAIGQRKDILVIVSTDMYHGNDYRECPIKDELTLAYLKDMDPEALYYGLRDGKLQLCGGLPAVSAIFLAKQLGYNKLEVLNYTNSAIVTGKKIKGQWTVGYASCAIAQEEGMLNDQQKKKLLELARSSLEAYLATGKRIEVKQTDPMLIKQSGAFVTLSEYGRLRGCIGSIVGQQPLCFTIRDMAIEAAVGDPRFSPVKLEDLKNIKIEISVLSPLKRVNSADEIELGKHGVLIKQGFKSGVFLPQVATETGWTKEEFMSSLCSHKAGLAPDAWKEKATEIYIFSAVVFSEKE